MDVEALCMASGLYLHVDVTVRNPMVQRYLEGTSNSANTDGFACATAWREKQARYPPKDGLICRVAAVEVLGRMGPEMLAHLQELSSMASSRCRLR